MTDELLTIDHAFADLLLPNGLEADKLLLARLLSSHRLGHLCLKEDDLPDFMSIPVKKEDDRLYLLRNWKIEEQILRHLKRLLYAPPKALSHSVPELNSEQQAALQNALTLPLSIIAGGPGTGKTFTAMQIAKTYLALGKKQIILAAPTGKAATHLASKLGLSGMTLHALLSSGPKEEEWLRADLILIDESSMIDASLFARLLSIIETGTPLVLMGDPHQLPAVEGGSIFADFVSTSLIPQVHLSQSLRAEKRELLELAQTILAGNSVPVIELTDHELIWEKVKDFVPLPSTEEPDLDHIWKQLSLFRLLSALRKGPFGTEALNQMIYGRLLESAQKGDLLPIPILITQNDQTTGLCNGDVGLLLHKIGEPAPERVFFEDGRTFWRSELPRYEKAYVLSVHKSQGSEYEQVVVIVPEGAENFGRELLYTAVTRARKSASILSTKKRIDQMLSQVSGKISGLPAKLISC